MLESDLTFVFFFILLNLLPGALRQLQFLTFFPLTFLLLL